MDHVREKLVHGRHRRPGGPTENPVHLLGPIVVPMRIDLGAPDCGQPLRARQMFLAAVQPRLAGAQLLAQILVRARLDMGYDLGGKVAQQASFSGVAASCGRSSITASAPTAEPSAASSGAPK